MTDVSTICSPLSGKNDAGALAPIALFVYNRREHAVKTINALRENTLAPLSDLFVIADGPKNEAGCSEVQQVRSYIRTIRGFRSVTILERDCNYGLARSVISGITQVCNEFGRVIAMEDDLLTTPDFLTFMNQGLERYAAEPRVYSISGFNFGLEGPRHYPYDAFCFYRSSSLGWGTWRDRWERADWNVSDISAFSADKEQQRRFNRGGEDLCRMLAMQMSGKCDSWAIRWAYTHFKQDAVALLSYLPRVFHIGSDRRATNSRWQSFKQLPLTSQAKSKFRFPESLQLEENFVRELQRSFRPSLARKLARYLLHGRVRLTDHHPGPAQAAVAKAESSVLPDPNRSPLGD